MSLYLNSRSCFVYGFYHIISIGVFCRHDTEFPIKMRKQCLKIAICHFNLTNPETPLCFVFKTESRVHDSFYFSYHIYSIWEYTKNIEAGCCLFSLSSEYSEIFCEVLHYIVFSAAGEET